MGSALGSNPGPLQRRIPYEWFCGTQICKLRLPNLQESPIVLSWVEMI